MLLAGAAVAAAGPIAFVGLAVPHVARALVGPDYRWIVPVQRRARRGAAAGRRRGRARRRAAGRARASGSSPRCVGAPFFIWLVRRRRSWWRCEAGDACAAARRVAAPRRPPAGGHGGARARRRSPRSSRASRSASSRCRRSTSSPRWSARATGRRDFIVLDLRLPRALTGLLAGAALGLAGAIFQDVTRNPLVSPDIVGVSGGASLAAVALIVLGTAAARRPCRSPRSPARWSAARALYALAWRGGVQGYRLVLVGIGRRRVRAGRASPTCSPKGGSSRSRRPTCGSSARSTAAAGSRCGRSRRRSRVAARR